MGFLFFWLGFVVLVCESPRAQSVRVSSNATKNTNDKRAVPLLISGREAMKTLNTSAVPSSAKSRLLELAAAELEALRCSPIGDHSVSRATAPFDLLTTHAFPPACFELLSNIPGNRCCVDCGESDPQWASISYGTLLCLRCSGRHRSLGVKTSFVRSIYMDTWSHSQVLAMLEGGNEQITRFFERHALTEKTHPCSFGGDEELRSKHNVTTVRYRTKAALFYREKLAAHVKELMNAGRYRGREEARRRKQSSRHRGASEVDSEVSRVLKMDERTNRNSDMRKRFPREEIVCP